MTIRCLIHNVIFSAEGLPEGMTRECPVCVKAELDKTKMALARVSKDRDILVAAIAIKRAATIEEIPT